MKTSGYLSLFSFLKAASVSFLAASSFLIIILASYFVRYLFRAGLCRMCASFPSSVRQHVDRYVTMSPPFEASREGKFLSQLVIALDERSDLKFVMAIEVFIITILRRK